VQAPAIDPRTFQDLVDEAKRRIPLYCPEWTDHNVSDPGVMLIELFAWMTDILLYRLNEVPERDFLKFLDLIGARPRAAVPATAELLFWLTAPSTGVREIRRGIEIATRQTETRAAVLFSTDTPLRILEPDLRYFVLERHVQRQTGEALAYEDVSERLQRGEPTRAEIFQPTPAEGDAFYLGFGENMSGHAIRLNVYCDRLRGSNINQDDPPLVWEYWNGQAWIDLQPAPSDLAVLRQVEPECDELGPHLDNTRGLLRDGRVLLLIPRNAATSDLQLEDRTTLSACWVRCRARRRHPEDRFYDRSPMIQSVRAETMGGMVDASHGFEVSGEVLGRSDGTSGQTYGLLNPPILPRRGDGEFPERLEVIGRDGVVEPWIEVETFAQSRPTDAHYTLDNLTGEVHFGPRIVSPSGEEQQYGRVPPKSHLIRFSRYRSGGGTIGNVGLNTLVVPKSASDLPYVKWVSNLRPAIGGRDRETLDAFRLRGPQLVRTREVAVTSADFETHALEASPRIGRVRCVAPRAQSMAPSTNGTAPGHVRVLLVPAISDFDRALSPEDLEVPIEARRSVYAYLRERCQLTTELVVAQPGYRWISVRARLYIRPRHDLDELAEERRRAAIVDGALKRLYAYIHPSTWSFGTSLTLGDVYPLLQRDADVEYVDEVRFRQITLTGNGLPSIGPDERLIRLGETELVCSYIHEIELQDDEAGA
jgi:predicted phage baseplate assembly protein